MDIEANPQDQDGTVYAVTPQNYPNITISPSELERMIYLLEQQINNAGHRINLTPRSGYFEAGFNNADSVNWFREALNQIPDINFLPLNQIPQIPVLTISVPNFVDDQFSDFIRNLGRENDGFSASKLRVEFNEENTEVITLIPDAYEFSYIAEKGFRLIINGINTQVLLQHQQNQE